MCEHGTIWQARRSKKRTASGILAREDVLSPDAPCCYAGNDCGKGEEGALCNLSI
jgi:hypothetical protein